MSKILMIIAPEMYQDIEYETPKKIFQEAGHEVTTASTVEIAKGKLGGSQKTDILIKDIIPENYDILVLVGGPGTPVYFEDKKVHDIAKNFYTSGKLTTAICAAPIILAHAELLKGKKATCYRGGESEIISRGAIYAGNSVEEDGTIITADGPSSAEAFAKRILQKI